MTKTPILTVVTLSLGITAVSAAVDFVTQVKPLLEQNCLSCHRENSAKGKFAMHTRAAAMVGGSSGVAIVAGKPDDSLLYALTTLPVDDDEIMPPIDKGGPLDADEIEVLRAWIEEGANWPDGVTLELPKKFSFEGSVKPILDKLTTEERAILRQWVTLGADWPSENPDNLDLVKKIHTQISSSPESAGLEPYSEEIPGMPLPLDMVAIPGGKFLMGSPETEAKRKAHEGPQREVEIAPFWMAKTEITWDLYDNFMVSDDRRNKDGSKMFPEQKDSVSDMVSRPTKPYQEMSFGMGKQGYPAICMTQHAANKFCQWISAQTGHFYRLPTEAEWEYACRAGTTTKYSWGDDEKEMDKYAWFVDNSNFKYQKVGQKLPNPWGLYDMHGNAAEWVLDGYKEDGYTGLPTNNPWHKAEKLYPRVARGGSWNDFPEDLRSAWRIASKAAWKMQDPQLPKSIWYHTEATFLGFRIVRPAKVPTPEEMHAYWSTGDMPPN
jgi:formylglycine-generating enzyme required for sulfatase activity